MANENLVKVELGSALVQTHLTTLQNIIQRMAGNSANCKSWCITLVSAILVVIVDKNKPELAWIPLLPIFAFGALDVYYLAMEKAFRHQYNSFVEKLHAGKLVANDFEIKLKKENMCCLRYESINSFSILGFYFLLLVLVAMVNSVIS